MLLTPAFRRQNILIRVAGHALPDFCTPGSKNDLSSRRFGDARRCWKNIRILDPRAQAKTGSLKWFSYPIMATMVSA